jgi:hypothetical protein
VCPGGCRLKASASVVRVTADSRFSVCERGRIYR